MISKVCVNREEKREKISFFIDLFAKDLIVFVFMLIQYYLIQQVKGKDLYEEDCFGFFISYIVQSV